MIYSEGNKFLENWGYQRVVSQHLIVRKTITVCYWGGKNTCPWSGNPSKEEEERTVKRVSMIKMILARRRRKDGKHKEEAEESVSLCANHFNKENTYVMDLLHDLELAGTWEYQSNEYQHESDPDSGE